MDRLQLRAQAVNRYINGVRSLCQNTDICQEFPEILRLLNFLCFNGIVAEPLSSTAGEISCNRIGPVAEKHYMGDQPELLIAPIDAEDAQFGPEWATLLTNRCSSQYLPKAHLIPLHMDFMETPTVLGLCLLQELAHAHRALTKGWVGKPKTENRTEEMEEERLLYRFEDRLMCALNPSAYDAALGNALEYLFLHHNMSAWKKEPTIIPFPQQHQYLAEILGPIDNLEYQKARHHNFAILVHCAYALRCAMDTEHAKELQRQIIAVFQ